MTIYVGIDDTDILDHPGTNQLARHLARSIAADYFCRLIVRHQLLSDPRVPCTTKNGSASLILDSLGDHDESRLVARLAALVRDWAPEGSDPGLCVASDPPAEVIDWGQRCQREFVDQSEARALAKRSGIALIGLGGTEGGVIGALAAVGLAASGDDGRVVVIGHSGDIADELLAPGGVLSAETILARGVDEIRCATSNAPITSGWIDVGKHLRPNRRRNRVVLFIAPAERDDDNDSPRIALRLT